MRFVQTCDVETFTKHYEFRPSQSTMTSGPRLWSESMRQLNSPVLMIVSFRGILTRQFEILFWILSRLIFEEEYRQRRDVLMWGREITRELVDRCLVVNLEQSCVLIQIARPLIGRPCCFTAGKSNTRKFGITGFWIMSVSQSRSMSCSSR